MKRIHLTALALIVTGTVRLTAAEAESGFTPLMDGKTFNGWKMSEENQETWKVLDGAFVANGKTCHLFYVGDEKPFKNFHLKVDVMTDPNSNGGSTTRTAIGKRPAAFMTSPIPG